MWVDRQCKIRPLQTTPPQLGWFVALLWSRRHNRSWVQPNGKGSLRAGMCHTQADCHFSSPSRPWLVQTTRLPSWRRAVDTETGFWTLDTGLVGYNSTTGHDVGVEAVSCLGKMWQKKGFEVGGLGMPREIEASALLSTRALKHWWCNGAPHGVCPAR